MEVLLTMYRSLSAAELEELRQMVIAQPNLTLRELNVLPGTKMSTIVFRPADGSGAEGVRAALELKTQLQRHGWA